MKCENCGKQATVHLTEIKDGKKTDRHLCEPCAADTEAGPARQPTPIHELLMWVVGADRRPPPGQSE